MWSKRDGFPAQRLLRGARPRASRTSSRPEDVARHRTSSGSGPAGCTERGRRLDRAPARDRGRGRERRRARRRPGRDRHRARPDGHDHGHLHLPHGPRARRARSSPACAATCEDGILPGLLRLRGRPELRRRPLRWFVEHATSRGATGRRRAERGIDIHALLQEKAAALAAGESGLLALDWWNGNRSVLVDVGARRAAHRRDARDDCAEEIYRALDRGDGLRHARRSSRRSRPTACRSTTSSPAGGLAEKSPLIMQIYADVTGRPFRISALRARRPRSGSAMFAAVAAGADAGGHRDDRGRRRRRWHACSDTVYEPIPANQATSTTSCTASTSGSTTTSAGARTTSCERCKGLRAAAHHATVGRVTMLERIRDELVAPARGAATQRPGRVDRRQHQRPRPGDGARRDQAIRRPLRGPDRGRDGRRRPRRAHRRGQRTSRRPTRPATCTSIAIGPTSTASSTPTRATRRRSPRSAGRSRCT